MKFEKWCKKLFLPVGIVAVAVWSLLAPQVGLWEKQYIGTKALIVAIFLISGMQADFRELKFDRKFFFVLLVGATLTLLLLPLAALGLLKLTGFDTMLAAGLLVMLAAPPTLSSGIVMTSQAKGNIMLAVAITVIFNLIAIFSMPMLLSLTLSREAVNGINGMSMFLQLIKLVLLPLCLGAIIRRFVLSGFWHWLMDYIPLLATVMLIHIFFSGARDRILGSTFSTLALTAGICVIFHLALLWIMWMAGRLLQLRMAERKALAFCGGSKTVTITLAVIAIINLDNTTAVIPGLLFYLIQMVLDSSIAAAAGTPSRSDSPPSINKVQTIQ